MEDTGGAKEKFPISGTGSKELHALLIELLELRIVEWRVSAFQARLWREIFLLTRTSLHQLNDHREQLIAGFDSDSGSRDVANEDVDASARRPEIDRGHSAELWRTLLAGYPLPLRFCHLCIRFRNLHRRFVNSLQ